MKLTLSCYCCGSTEFEYSEHFCHKVEGEYYLMHEDIENKDKKVICSKCGLDDYIENLVVKIQ